MSKVQKRYLWIGGAFGLIVLALIVGAVRPYKHAMGAPPSTPDVEVTQVQNGLARLTVWSTLTSERKSLATC
jgi:hypothetical protein